MTPIDTGGQSRSKGAGASASSFLYKTSNTKYFAFNVNKILDLHYLLLYNSNNNEYPFLNGHRKIYQEMLEPELDFNLIFEQLRYPLSESGGKQDLARRLQTVFEELSKSVSDNLIDAYGVYEERVWPSHRELFDESFAYLQKEFYPIEAMLFQQLTQSLNMQFKPPIQIFFVGEGTKFGGFTSEPSLTVINVRMVSGMYLVETVIHEVMHGVEDVNSKLPKSAPAVLRRELARLNKSEAFDNAWHALIFWNAGELIRRHVAANHVHYGVKFGVYERAFKKERELYSLLWNRYLDGTIDMEEAIAGIAAGL